MLTGVGDNRRLTKQTKKLIVGTHGPGSSPGTVESVSIIEKSRKKDEDLHNGGNKQGGRKSRHKTFKSLDSNNLKGVIFFILKQGR